MTGSLGPTAWLLFAIIFFWTPPHFWALSLLLQQHYARAGIPMLPVVRGEDETRRQIIYYTLQMIAVTALRLHLRPERALLPGGRPRPGGRLPLPGLAPVAGRQRPPRRRHLFHYSMLYLWLLCAALVVDQRLF